MKEEAQRKGRKEEEEETGSGADSCYRHNVAAAADIKQPHLRRAGGGVGWGGVVCSLRPALLASQHFSLARSSLSLFIML